MFFLRSRIEFCERSWCLLLLRLAVHTKTSGQNTPHWFCHTSNHLEYLNSYFGFHVCLYFSPSSILRPSVCPKTNSSFTKCHFQKFLVCVRSEIYAFWVTLRHLWSMRQGKVEINALQYFTRHSWSAFIKTHYSVSSPPQCWSQAVVRVSTPRMYPQAGSS